MTNHDTCSPVDRRLESAEHLAAAAVRTLLVSLPLMEPRGILRILDDVDHIFCLIDAVESRVRLARAAGDPEDALEYADDAYSLARAALEEAAERVRGVGGAHELAVRPLPREGIDLPPRLATDEAVRNAGTSVATVT